MKLKALICFLLLLALAHIAAEEANIHLYGEMHGSVDHINEQYELWKFFYTEENYRHLFLEMPYFSAEFLNIWMREDNDYLLDSLFEEMNGTAICTPANIEFFRKIKMELPETVFHGTDIGHLYSSTGYRFLDYLSENGMRESEQYSLTLQAIEQGRRFYYEEDFNHRMRSELMVSNFIREFDSLNGQSIMSAFYGAAHVALGNYPLVLGGGPTMASQLARRYGDLVRITELRQRLRQNLSGTPAIYTIGDFEYRAIYYGEQDISAISDTYTKRELWRLVNAYDDFRHEAATGVLLPFTYFPMRVHMKEVYVIRYTHQNGSSITMYFRTSGNVLQNMDAAEEFIIP